MAFRRTADGLVVEAAAELGDPTTEVEMLDHSFAVLINGDEGLGIGPFELIDHALITDPTRRIRHTDANRSAPPRARPRSG